MLYPFSFAWASPASCAKDTGIDNDPLGGFTRGIAPITTAQNIRHCTLVDLPARLIKRTGGEALDKSSLRFLHPAYIQTRNA